MLISIIAAMAKNRVIGKNNALPWNLPEDLEHFRQLTLGKPLIMGQRTFESIGKPLPQRINIILSRDDNFSPSGCFVAKSIDEALKQTKGAIEVMIIGGASVYKQFLPLTNKMYLTMVEEDFEGDAYFPEFSYNEWEETERVVNKGYSFITLIKKP